MLAPKWWLLIIALLLPGAAGGATLMGKATIDGDAVAGVEVSAYPLSVLDFSDPAPYRAGPTGPDGLFKIELPGGQYYLLARGAESFAYYGRNPLAVPESGLDNINLLMEPDNLPVSAGEVLVTTGVAGVVTEKGQPVTGAVVMVYTDLSSQLKGLGLGMSAPTGPDGRFELSLSPGRYYLVARVRGNGMLAGPLRAGDGFGYLPDNPVTVRDGGVAAVHIPVIKVPEKVDRYASSLFGNTTIRGRIVDSAGEPVAGLRALLYEDSMMLNRPLYVSQPTAEDGAFVLSFPAGGTYYLAARDELGGTPAPGELYGRYQGSDDHTVEVETGKTLEDVEIRVEEVY